MNTEALHYFIKVYELKSITSAAKELFITPQGVSKTIKKLEFDLKTELFIRGGYGVKATESGELLYTRAKVICSLIEEAIDEINCIHGNKDVLNIVSTYSASLAVPAAFIFAFSNTHADIQINLREFPDENPVKKMLYEKADFYLFVGNEHIENCDCTLIIPGQTVILVPRNHSLAVKNEISINELKDMPLVLLSGEGVKETLFTRKCLENGFTPNIFHITRDTSSMHTLCRNLGIAAVSVDFAETAFVNSDLKVLKIKEKIPQNVYLIARKCISPSIAVSLFQNYIAQYGYGITQKISIQR